MSAIGVVYGIDDYDDHDSISAAIRDALHCNPAVASTLVGATKATHVVLKPNWIQEAPDGQSDDWTPLITHPSIVLAVIEELLRMCPEAPRITICDAPHTYADFEKIADLGRLRDSVERLRRDTQADIRLLDLRREVWEFADGVVKERRPNPPDPEGYVAVNLGARSKFYGHHGEGRYYGADYDTRVVNAHHRGTTQEYLIAGTPYGADVLINLPKMKTHKKTGITGALKNLVGVNGDKNWLPHHTMGYPGSGGDEFDTWSRHLVEGRLKRRLQQIALRAPALGGRLLSTAKRSGGRLATSSSEARIRNGNWYHNDTCWRMAHDLNVAILGDDVDRIPYVAIVDGVVAGEGAGPLSPEPVDAGTITFGDDPWLVDAALCIQMGFDPRRVPSTQAVDLQHPTSMSLHDDQQDVLPLSALPRPKCPSFRPHPGWVILENTWP